MSAPKTYLAKDLPSRFMIPQRGMFLYTCTAARVGNKMHVTGGGADLYLPLTSRVTVAKVLEP